MDASVPPASRYPSPPYFIEAGDSRVTLIKCAVTGNRVTQFRSEVVACVVDGDRTPPKTKNTSSAEQMRDHVVEVAFSGFPENLVDERDISGKRLLLATHLRNFVTPYLSVCRW